MLEILHHDRVGTLVLQAFGPVSRLDPAIAQQARELRVARPVHYTPLPRLRVSRPCPAGASADGHPHAAGFCPAAATAGRGPTRPAPSRSNLIGVIGHPNPIVSRLDGLAKSCHADTQQPHAKGRPGGKRLLHPKPFPDNLQNMRGRRNRRPSPDSPPDGSCGHQSCVPSAADRPATGILSALPVLFFQASCLLFQGEDFLLLLPHFRLLARYRSLGFIELLLQLPALLRLRLPATPKKPHHHPQGRLEIQPYISP